MIGFEEKAQHQSGLPSFSIVLETENLANADLQGLGHALSALAAQSLSPMIAKEVLLIDSGDVPPDRLQQLIQQYPWLKVEAAPADADYYQAKMWGAASATGDVVVYYDCDCDYPAHWLETMLTPFSRSATVQVVAGETTTKGVGLYGTAMALVYIFPQYSEDADLQPTQQYFLNNVAFRRSLLLQQPIPTDLPLYRGNCVIHAQQLRQSGVTIWRHPQARALHAPPNGLKHFFWRFLLIGHDYYWQKRLLPPAKQQSQPLHTAESTTESTAESTMDGMGGKLRVFSDRVGKMICHDRRHLWFLPFSILVVMPAALLIYLGYQITAWQPNYLLEHSDHH